MSSSKLKSKTPAEFFAEHQNIAGFDNPGKSLYTTIREFVENGLDASEAVRVLPEIKLTVSKLSEKNFRELRGLHGAEESRKDHSLYTGRRSLSRTTSTPASSQPSASQPQTGETKRLDPSLELIEDILLTPATPTATPTKAKRKGKGGKKKGVAFGSQNGYFRVTCEDNGSGMPHQKIPNMLGIVLSSTKYGVKQTRGKYGLGAKMALVWSKKSTGLPIEVWSACEDSETISYCKLDLDIQKNRPNVLVHSLLPNPDGWRGTRISVVIGGAWSSYQRKVINYVRQLAVITPYAEFHVNYVDETRPTKSFELEFSRRSDRLPAPCIEMKYHPSSCDNLLVESLIYGTKTRTLKKFLSTEFSSISPKLADRLIKELGAGFTATMRPKDLQKKQIHRLTQLFKAAKFPKPVADVLSPAGEYNIRLGIIKELAPDMIATFSEQPAVYEGHPFLVEGAVCLGGKFGKAGVTCYRYANRIPLLFEGGSDVVTQVASKDTKWSTYKINTKNDRVGVFISIVSTKIPFKGTSKEYIGDDKGVLHKSVKHCIQQCAIQLKKRIMTHKADKTRADRVKNLNKYIPDVSRAVFGVLEKMANPELGSIALGPTAKKAKYAADAGFKIGRQEAKQASAIIRKVMSKSLTVKTLSDKLKEHIVTTDKEYNTQFQQSSGKRDTKLCDAMYLGIRDKQAELAPSVYHPAFYFKLALQPGAIVTAAAPSRKRKQPDILDMDSDDADEMMV
jgi:DNA topoisomerase VI B subunit